MAKDFDGHELPSNLLESINTLLALVGTQILFEQDFVYLLLKDGETGWHPRAHANKTHAQVAAIRILAMVDATMISEFLRTHEALKQSSSEYLACFYRNLEKGLEELEAREPV